jgi:hypothetical protein
MTPSVYIIDETLSQLMLMREEPDITDDERAAIDGQIEKWMAAEVSKVDRVRSYLLHCKMMREAAAEEKQRQVAREKQWAAREDRLKQIVQYVMEAQQRRRCEGETGVLRLQGNGGQQELIISNPDLVSDDLCDYRGWISGKAWGFLRSFLGTEWWLSWSGRQDVQMERTPHGGRIREALKLGTVPGAHLAERGSHVRVE